MDYRGNAGLLESKRGIVQTSADISYSFNSVVGSRVPGATLDLPLDQMAGIRIQFTGALGYTPSITQYLTALVLPAKRSEAVGAGRQRSLLPAQKQLHLIATCNRSISPGTFLRLSGLFDEQRQQSLQGWPISVCI